MSRPQPVTATVLPPASRLPRCAAESTPRASPLATTIPRSASSAASREAIWSAYGDAAREPMSATHGAARQSRAPFAQSTGGGSSVQASRAGYRSSPYAIGSIPIDFAVARAVSADLKDCATASRPSAEVDETPQPSSTDSRERPERRNSLDNAAARRRETGNIDIATAVRRSMGHSARAATAGTKRPGRGCLRHIAARPQLKYTAEGVLWATFSGLIRTDPEGWRGRGPQ